MKKLLWNACFLLVLLMVSYYYNYNEIVFKRPQSVHKWRQSDCASLAMNYYQNGMDFFQPETHNLTSEGGTSGKACTSEIPILYYTVAALYKVFGANEAIYRILNTFLFFIGLFYLFRILSFLLDDYFWAIGITVLFFTSPVLVFYGNNFLSNSSALALSIVGWYYFIRFYYQRQNKWFVIAVLLFLLAAAFKVTALFSLFAIGGLYLLEVFMRVRCSSNGELFNKPVLHFLLMAGAVAIVLAWIFYARYYNLTYDCTYFSTTIFPVWMLNKFEIIEVLNHIKKMWLWQYYHASVLFFLLISLAFIVVFYKRNKKVFNIVLVLLVIEIVSYILLQFWTFKDHDYYTIDMFILPVAILLSAFYIFKKSFHKIFKSLVTRLVFAGFVLFNISYAHEMNAERYNGWMNNFGVLDDSYSITSYLREIGVTSNDTIISIPDGSHVSLYLTNQKGWTEYRDARFNRGEPISYNSSESEIFKSKNRGARYLIVNGIGQLYEKPYLQSFCTYLAGRYNNTLIFDLKHTEINFNLEGREIKETFLCNAETLSGNRKEFYGQPDSVIFHNGETQSNDFAKSGTFSCKLLKEAPYGCTIRFKDLEFGESFQVSVWRLKNKKGRIIASAEGYYNGKSDIIKTQGNWEKLQMEFFVTKELENKELGLYLYNPDEEPVYFDDLEIIRYYSVLN